MKKLNTGTKKTLVMAIIVVAAIIAVLAPVLTLPAMAKPIPDVSGTDKATLKVQVNYADGTKATGVTITVYLSDGTTKYEDSKNPSTNNPLSIEKVPVGSYVVKVTNAGTLLATKSITIDSTSPWSYIYLGSAPVPAPVASFTAPATATTGISVGLIDTSSGSPTSWAWDFSDDGTVDSALQNPSFAFPAAGTYTVRLTVSNAGGSSTTTRTVAVSDPLPSAPVASFDAPATATTGISVGFTDTSSGSPTSWSWDFDNDGTPESTQQNPAYAFPGAGTYTVKLTVANSGGSTSATRSITVSDPLPTTVTVSGTVQDDGGNALTGATVTLAYGEITITTTSGSDGSFTFTGVPVNTAFTLSATYDVYASADLSGATVYSDVTGQVLVITLPDTPATVTIYGVVMNSAEHPQSGATVTLQYGGTTRTATSGAGGEFSFGEVPAGTEFTLRATYGSSSSDVTSDNSDNSIENEYTLWLMQAQSTPTPTPVAAFTASPISGTAPLTVQFDASGSTDCTEYSWNFGDGTAAGEGITTSHQFTGAGEYTVTLTVTGPGGSDTASAIITVSPALEATPTPEASPSPSPSPSPSVTPTVTPTPTPAAPGIPLTVDMSEFYARVTATPTPTPTATPTVTPSPSPAPVEGTVGTPTPTPIGEPATPTPTPVPTTTAQTQLSDYWWLLLLLLIIVAGAGYYYYTRKGGKKE